MENTVEIYQEEKELRGKRLAAYAGSIQEKVREIMGSDPIKNS